MLRRLACLLIAVAVPLSAMAAQATLGGTSVNLPAPRGFCELSDDNASDHRMLTILGDALAKSGNKLLSQAVDCQQLDDWHSNKRQLIDDYSQYQTPLSTIDGPPSETIKQTCATLRSEGDKIAANQTPDIKARMEAAVKNLKLNENIFLGVLAEDPNACYGGTVQQLHTEVGTEKTQLTLFAVTAVKNKTMFAYRFAVYMGSATVENTLAKLKDNVDALYAANK
jgi:hypothetical protein